MGRPSKLTETIPPLEAAELAPCFARFELARRGAIKDWSPESSKELIDAMSVLAATSFWLGFIRGSDKEWMPKEESNGTA